MPTHRVQQGEEKVIFDGGARYTLARWLGGARPRDESERRLTSHEARWALARIFGPVRDVELGDTYRALLPDAARVRDPADVHGMRDALLEAAERGDLLVFEAPLAGAFLEREAEVEEARPPARAAKETTTWIGIELEDDQDPPQPVVFASYRIELPDGSTRTGTLDGLGRARLDGIDPGTCKVSFPGFDGRDWS